MKPPAFIQEPAPTNMRTQVLDTAKSIVSGARETTYGGPESSFLSISRLWSAYLEIPISPADVAILMALMKIARLQSSQGTHFDSWVDLAGYAACGAECGVSQP